MNATTPTHPMNPREFLAKHCACDEGARFALRYKTMAEVWDHCPRADWLLWIMQRLGQEPDHKALRLFACWCVRFTPIPDGRTVWDLLTDDRSRNAVVVTERFANGDATAKELSDARSAAAAYAATATAAAAYAAAYAAADAAAATAAAAADYAAATAAAAADYAAATGHARKFQADHFRAIFSNPFTS